MKRSTKRAMWWVIVAGFAIATLVQVARSDMVRFTHTKPENVAEWWVVFDQPRYAVSNVQVAPDGTMQGTFGPGSIRMIAIGHDGLESTVSLESAVFAVSKACRSDLNNDGAVGPDDVGYVLTQMMLVTPCR